MFSRFLSVLVVLLAILYVGALITVYALPHFDYTFAEVGADNAALGLTDGDSIILKKADTANIRAGDVVAFTYKDYEYPAFLEVKTVNKTANTLILYMDKAKNATTSIASPAVQGVMVVRLPHLAGAIAFLQNFMGKMLAAVITGGFIIVRFGLGFKRKGGLEL